jgi:hypothetical protein
LDDVFKAFTFGIPLNKTGGNANLIKMKLKPRKVYEEIMKPPKLVLNKSGSVGGF